MQKINKKCLIPPIILVAGISCNAIAEVDSNYYLQDRENDPAFDMISPIEQVEMLIKNNGNIRVKFNLDQSANSSDPEACVIADKIEVLTN